MRIFVLAFCLFLLGSASAQPGIDTFPTNYQYISFQPLALFESPMAVGVGYGNRFSKRSEIFTSLDYLTPNPLFSGQREVSSGFRSITQYRFHFLNHLRPLISRRSKQKQRRLRYESFMALEFRMKNYNFSGTANFINQISPDTLWNRPYNAKANVLGGAVLFGAAFRLGASGKWRIEISTGLGHKQRSVRFKDVPANYKAVDLDPKMFRLNLYEPLGSPYLPFAVRIRYRI